MTTNSYVKEGLESLSLSFYYLRNLNFLIMDFDNEQIKIKFFNAPPTSVVYQLHLLGWYTINLHEFVWYKVNRT